MSVRWIWNRCARHEQPIALLISGVLPPEEEVALELHLSRCGSCRRYYAELKPIGLSLAEAGGTLPNAAPSPSLSDRWERLVRAKPTLEQRVSPRLGAMLEPARERGLLLRRVGPARKAAWAGFATAWGLVLFFNLTAPEVEGLPARRIQGAPGAMLELLRSQEEWLALRPATGEGARDERRISPHPNSESPRSGRKTNLLLA